MTLRQVFLSIRQCLSRLRHIGRKHRIIAGVLLIFVVASLAYFSYGVKADASGVCDLIHPIRITVHNHTFRRLPKVSIRLEGWRDGRSFNILDRSQFTFDRVIAPFSSETLCYQDANVKGIDLVFGNVLIVVREVNPEFY